jgi:hypothetical protein
MVHLYTRFNNFCDLIMREKDDRFEVELRRRRDLLDSFSSHGMGSSFPKKDRGAEHAATKEYYNILEAVEKYEEEK